ncbi:MAG: (2Fe-2S) ferredoxin domain-containing protein [Polyangiaceae bacterium]
MRVSEIIPKVHLFVCANRRPADSPLGTGCADAGDALFDALKAEVAARRDYTRVWVTKTACLGICPTHGATCARYPLQRIYSEAEASDAGAIYESLTKGDS